MKFTINKSVLLDALVLTGKAINPKTVIPILNDYLFEIKGNAINITGGSEGFFVSKSLEFMGDGSEKSIAIPSAKFLNIIKAIPDQPITFVISEKQGPKVVERNLQIKSSTGNYNLPVEDGADYIQMSISETESFEVPLQPLLSSINKTIFACGTDDLRPALTGLFIKFVDNNAILVGCNAALISISSMPVDFKSEKSFIIPTKILTILQQVATGESIKITLGDNNIRFLDSTGIELKARLIDERYVDYEPVIPAIHDKQVTLDVSQMIGAIKRVSLFTELSADVIKISFSAHKCELSAKNSMGEHASEELSIQYDGELFEFGASGKQFSTCLSKMEGEEANLLLTTPGRAIVMADDPTTVALKRDFVLVMPFKIPE